MFTPPHPGLTLRDDILPALNLQVGEAAAQLGVDRTTLSKVLNGRAAVMVSKVRLGVKALKLQTA
jgi:addiction module HigA family antidote